MFLTELDVRAMPGGKWVLLSELQYQIPGTRDIVIAPKGMRTDLASVPRILRALVPGQDATRAPAVIHDYLYQRKIGSRAWADEVFLYALRDSGASIFTRWLCYAAVRSFGWVAR